MYNNNSGFAAKLIAIILFFVIILALGTGLSGCEPFKRDLKTMSSEWGGGLNRTVSVYDYNGGLIKSWTGQFDVSENTDEVWFDIDGKRIIITGGIVINEEN